MINVISQFFFQISRPVHVIFKSDKWDYLGGPRKEFFFDNFFSIGQGPSNAGKVNWNLLVFFSFIFIFEQCTYISSFRLQTLAILYRGFWYWWNQSAKSSRLVVLLVIESFIKNGPCLCRPPMILFQKISKTLFNTLLLGKDIFDFVSLSLKLHNHIYIYDTYHISAETILFLIFRFLKISYSFRIKFSLMQWKLE